MLTPNRFNPPIPPCCLLLYPDRLTLRSHDSSTTLEDPLVQIRRPFERVIPASNDGRSIEAQDVAGRNVGHVEWETNDVAWCYEVRPRVDVGGDEVGRLGEEER